jgi:uncharacterized repeat protein (TIGR03806 family)
VRYEVSDADPDLADPSSAVEILEYPQPNWTHNGGMLAFGPEDLLYVGTGDGGGSFLDSLGTAQDITTLLGALLRIDVRQGAPLVPPDNPFVAVPGAAGEVFHYGLRNPWRFSFDRLTGDLWIGDVGQTSWEEIDFLPAGTPGGANFGWAFCEGTHDVGNRDCSSIQSVAPVWEYPRSDGRSVTGGYVYRGDLFPELYGAYLFADFATRNVWALTPQSPDPPQLIATANSFISSLGEDRDGEVYLVTLDGAILRLERSAGAGGVGSAPFPSLLSATGFFTDVASLEPAPGLVEYHVTTPLWSDGGFKRRWIALPGDSRIAFHAREPWGFPVGTAFIKHFELPLNGGGTVRLETRVLLRQLTRWVGVTYVWNMAETDADLVTDGLDEVIDLGGSSQTWHYPSSAECLGCHTQASGRVLGVRTRQLGGTFDYPDATDVQLHAWNCIGLFDTDVRDAARYDHYAALDDLAETRLLRARSHLATNCAICHQPLGPAPGGFDLRFDPALADLGVIGVAPSEGDLGLFDPQRIKAGSKEESVLWLRLQSDDVAIRMALGTQIPNPEAVMQIGQWIDADLFVLDSETAWILVRRSRTRARRTATSTGWATPAIPISSQISKPPRWSSPT